ncbi:MAG: hypothetical protein KAS32_10490 [Candidatus Peribacteraceae bacterium]|nr:hypothetical protein [Candidatus Peribacteraceae bacterium]
MNILISGRKQSGKTTLAGFLEEKLAENNIHSETLSLAQPIKEIVCELWGAPMGDMTQASDLDREEIKNIMHPCGKTYRELLVYVGEFMRKLDPDVWVNDLLRRIEESYANYIFIPDVRFPNEIEKLGGKSIRLTRKISDDNDETEIALDNYHDFDYIIENDNIPENMKNVRGWWVMQDILDKEMKCDEQ